jgi:hypothetical protein
MSYHSNGDSETTGPSSNTPNFTNTPSTNDVSNYNQTSNLNNSRSIHIITPEKLRSAVLEFPPNPSIGDTYVKHNIQYTWNGQYWEANNARYFVDRFTRYNIDTLGELP